MSTILEFFETLQRIAFQLGPSYGFQASLKTILGILAQRHAFVRPHLVIFDPETRSLRLCVAESSPRAGQVVYTPGVGITGQVFVTGKPVIVERMFGHPLFLCKFFERTTEEMETHAFLSVPVLVRISTEQHTRQVLGVLSADTPCTSLEELHTLSRFLELVADLIATQTDYLLEATVRHKHPTTTLTMQPPKQEPDFVAHSKKMCAILEQAICFGQRHNPLFLHGEPGTGKTRLAHTIHRSSARRELPMLHFQCAETNEETAARELFGYKKGAFSEATQTQKGLFELAQNSDIFLENIESLSPRLQNAVAAVLQDQQYTRLGGGDPIDVNVRLICSSHLSPEKLVQEGRIVDALATRLFVQPLALPPLRERREDILPLAKLFLRHASKEQQCACPLLSETVQEILMDHLWPDNLHELQETMCFALKNMTGDNILPLHLPTALQHAVKEQQTDESFTTAIERFEQNLLAKALQQSNGNMLQAAKNLKTSYRVINYKVKKYGLSSLLKRNTL